MDAVFTRLSGEGVPFLLESYSALDRYFRVREPGDVFIRTDASLVTLAKLFDGLAFPGGITVDAALDSEGKLYFFRCVDEMDVSSGLAFTALDLLYNTQRDTFRDPHGIYPDLRQESLVRTPTPATTVGAVMQAARLVSRYHYTGDLDPDGTVDGQQPPSVQEQRELLTAILTSRYSDKGLELLRRAGFVAAVWPELAAMTAVEQSKEHHPEGDVWTHTLAALSSRKHFGLALGAALLLHDMGKPSARENGNKERPFENHAEIGAALATRFLRRLGFSDSFTQRVDYLVRFHMMPAALNRLPLYRTERLMSSPFFPELLDLYQADLASSYRSPSGYYEACRIYQRFMKGKANPYWDPQKSRPLV
jgi:poly(A) polymerase